MSARARPLPCPTVRFEELFLARVERLCLRLGSARARREGAGAASLAGGGDDFIGHRPYQRGEDLRHLDWSLLARLDRPFVRVLRRAAGERWLVVLDASASMGVGPPGKLQRAAELAAAIATLGLRLGAETCVTVARARPTSCRLGRTSRLPEMLRFLEDLHADGVFDLAAVLRERELASSARVFVVGDLLGTPRAELSRLASARRPACAIQLLAPHEIAPTALGAVEWIDPESGAVLGLAVDEPACTGYAVELAVELELWRTTLAAHRVAYGCFSSAVAFEDVLLRMRIA